MNRLIQIAVVVLGGTLAVSGTVRLVQTRAVFEGSVVDERTGQPVVGAEVTIAEGTSAPPDFARFQKGQDSPPPISEPGGVLIVTRGGASGDTLITTTRTSATGEKETTTEQVLPSGERRQVNPADLPLPTTRFIRTVKTDSLGKFVFDDIAPGTYTLAASADEYLYQVYGQRMEFGPPKPLNLVAGTNDLVIRLSPTATVSGAVTNSEREPIVGIPVCLLQPTFDASGERRFRVAAETRTAKDGHYALTGLAAGRYYLAAGGSEPLRPAPSQSALLYALTYYPNVSTPDLAAFIDVLSGSPMSLSDLVVSRQVFRTVRGQVRDSATGKPPRSVTLSLIGRQPFDRAGQWSASSLRADYDASSGNFEFRNVPAGQYRVDAALPRAAATGQFPFDFLSLVQPVPQDAYAMVNVSDTDVENVMLLIHEPGHLQVRVIVAGGRSLAEIFHEPANDLQFSLEATLPLQPAVRPTSVNSANGVSEIRSLFAGRYRFDIFPLPENVYVSDARLNGMRIADGILDIPEDSAGNLVLTLNPDGGEIHGTVTDNKSLPLAGAVGLLLPDPLPETTGFYSPVYTDADGRFALHGIAPGNYRIYVWDSIGELQYFDRDLLIRSRQRATAAHIENGSRLTVTVRSILP